MIVISEFDDKPDNSIMGLLVFKSNDFFRVINYNAGRKMAAAEDQLVTATAILVVSGFILTLGLVSEVTISGEDEGHAQGISHGDGFLVADATARLGDDLDSVLSGIFDAVVHREEGIGD